MVVALILTDMRRIAHIIIASSAALALSSCGSTSPAPSASHPPSAVTTTEQTSQAVPVVPLPPTLTRQAKWVDLQVGDCLTGPPPSDPSTVEVELTNCQAPHTAEVFLRAKVAVNDAISGVADQRCTAGLVQYTARHGDYTSTYLIDSNMDRTGYTELPSTVICLLQSSSGRPLTGSARA